jgi:hypothetical protein
MFISGLYELDILDYLTLLSSRSKTGMPISAMLFESKVVYCLRMTVLYLQGALASLELALLLVISCFYLIFQKYFSI